MLSASQVMEMAPDAASAEAGRNLARLGSWQTAGQDDLAIWGEFKGSSLHQIRVAKSDLSYKCSCPSRKFPCKHVLGLLLIAAESPESIAKSSLPDWVAHWLAERANKSKAAAADLNAATVKYPREKPRSVSNERRHGRIGAGIAELQVWLEDLVRHGLSELERKPFSFWETQAARLVDAQAPGLASRLRRCATIPRSGPDWPTRLLSELGRTALLCRAFERLEQLDPLLQDDVRQAVGISLKHEEVLARGVIVQDFWQLVGQEVDDEDRIRVQRTWIVGERTGTVGLVLQFSAGRIAFAEPMPVGTRMAADVVFWPSATPRRAKFIDRKTEPQSISLVPSGYSNIEAMLQSVASSVSRNPWSDSWPAILLDIRLGRTSDDQWHIVDGKGKALPLTNRVPWRLLAATLGQPATLFGIWNGSAFHCHGGYVDAQYQTLS